MFGFYKYLFIGLYVSLFSNAFMGSGLWYIFDAQFPGLMCSDYDPSTSQLLIAVEHISLEADHNRNSSMRLMGRSKSIHIKP